MFALVRNEGVFTGEREEQVERSPEREYGLPVELDCYCNRST